MCYDQVRQLIKDSDRIVVLSGSAMMYECGLRGVRQEAYAYEVEEKYGYSPEEIASIECLNRRVDTFYRYYKNEIIDLDKMHPGTAHRAIAELEKRGKLKAVITREVYGLHKKAGIQSVIELHGNVDSNRCPRCGKRFGADYVASQPGTPLCDCCKVILKPGIALYGEAMDNGLMSKAAEMVQQSDMLLVVGNSTQSNLTRYVLQYYTGRRLVTINETPEPGDEAADYAIYGRCDEILPKLVWS